MLNEAIPNPVRRTYHLSLKVVSIRRFGFILFLRELVFSYLGLFPGSCTATFLRTPCEDESGTGQR